MLIDPASQTSTQLAQNDYIMPQKALLSSIKQQLQKGQSESTFVEMRSDYENDIEICLTSVVFVPLAIGKAITETVISPLHAIAPEHYYYSPDLLHITIKNVRTIHHPPLFNESDILKANQVFAEIVPTFLCFNFLLEEVILFPTSISVIGYADRTLQELVQALDYGLRQIGVPDNKTYFSVTTFFGNLTCCRLTQSPSQELRDRLQSLDLSTLGAIPVQQIHLITCNAVCHPNSRTVIGTYRLQ
jgi:2'-5' RNA ligase